MRNRSPLAVCVALAAVGCAVEPAADGPPAPTTVALRPAPAPARSGPLEIAVSPTRGAFRSGERVDLTFCLTNVGDEPVYIGDGWLSPGHAEFGPGRHFELDAADESGTELRFWGEQSCMCDACGVRKVYLLKPGESYRREVRLSHGSFATAATDAKHRLGVDSKRYTVWVVYQVNTGSHGVHQPPPGFDPKRLWLGKIASGPIELEFE